MTDIKLLLQRNLLHLFNERIASRRLALLEELWAPEGVFTDSEGTYTGHKNISNAVGDLLRRYPECDFSARSEGDELPCAGRLLWSFGSLGEAPIATGLDVMAVNRGLIATLYKFLDGAAL
jgi:hypothetical protein